ncbi:MAG: hypothetical protein KBH81_05595 [Phycisphaerae bacterium]|jgi:hypothetical protein|nr:hypothetical protein [Phycisphaerae bacterium]HOO17255.1 hypothetical protein [Phycisphaerae bacterium]HPC23717.1 hypothetical protein [Phycisphaerae bacterium]HRS29511.1 hypothetical protein [Phycisphaerae bacterium]HRT42356.1 hypothetical protein [Phycisphaerae bacterium]
MPKNVWLAALICANVVLLVGIVLVTCSLPAAHAQGVGAGSDLLAVSGEIQDKYDALYLLDTREHTLHVFMWDKSTRQLHYTDWRDLDRDFRTSRD